MRLALCWWRPGHGSSCGARRELTFAKPFLPRRALIKDLARLNASFLDTRLLSRSDWMRFLITYLSEDPQTGSPKQLYWREVTGTTENQLRKSGKRFM